MAKATVVYEYSEGGSVACITELDATYPDALRECVANTRRLFREVMTDQERDTADDEYIEEQP